MPRTLTEQASHVSITRSGASEGIQKLARLGYASLGVVYLIIGGLALERALGRGGATTDAQGAFGRVLEQPFGKFLLGLMAIGLAAYAAWRFIQAGSSGLQRTEMKERVKAAGLGVIHAGLAIAAARMALGMGGTQGGGTSQMAGSFMNQPFGQWLVGLAGVVLIGFGISRIISAVKAKFQRHMEINRMSPTQRKWAVRSGKAGISAQGIVFGITGAFLVQAAVTHDPSRARGLDGVLASLLQQPFGRVLLGLVAVGLLAYALFMFVEARFHRIEPTPEH